MRGGAPVATAWTARSSGPVPSCRDAERKCVSVLRPKSRRVSRGEVGQALPPANRRIRTQEAAERRSE